MDKQGIFKYALMSYLPQKYLRHASFEAQEADRLIIDFKSRRKYATERVSRLFAKTLSLMDLKDTIIVCIPASCQRTYTRRFRKFSENVCAKTGAINGFDHIKVIGKREKVHISGERAAEDNVWIDTGIFQGKRRQNAMAALKPDMGTATRIYNYMLPKMMDLETEHFYILLMNNNYWLIKAECISMGGLTEVSVDVRIIMREAVLNNATIMAICHNNPSGSLHPSKYDDMLTQSVKKAYEIMRIHFADHMIVTDGAYYSYSEQGKI